MTRQLSLFSAAALAVMCAVGTASAAHAQFNVCPRLAPAGPTFVIRTWHPFGLSTNNQPNPWDSHTQYDYDITWSGYWYLNTGNYAIWWGGGYVSQTFSTWDGHEVVQRGNLGSQSLLGISHQYIGLPIDQLAEMDIEIDGNTNSSGRQTTTQTAYTTSCVPASSGVGFSETQTLLHELGHSYSYAHFDGWASTMNTSQSDVVVCELGTNPTSLDSMFVTPDPQPTQCHDIVYGVPAGKDLALTPVFQATGCNLANNGCLNNIGNGAGSPQTFATNASTGSALVAFTQLNNLDAWSGTVMLGIYMSRDNVVDSGDVRIQSVALTNGNVQGEVRGRIFLPSFDPRVALPVRNVLFHILVRIDDTGVIAETRESNNVIDTRNFFMRL